MTAVFLAGFAAGIAATCVTAAAVVVAVERWDRARYHRARAVAARAATVTRGGAR